MAAIEIPNPEDAFRKLLQMKQEAAPKKEIEEEVEDISVITEKAHTALSALTNLVGRSYMKTEGFEENDNNIDPKKLTITIKGTFSIYKERVKASFESFKEQVETKINQAREQLLSPIINKKQRDGLKLYEDVKGYLDSFITDSLATISGFTSKTFSWALDFTKSATKCITNFLIGPFKAGWVLFDKLMANLTGPVWAGIKQVVGYGVTVVKWVTNFGIEALKYIWSGVKTIFNFTVASFASTAKFLMAGVKGFFNWWFKLTINSILSLNPINIALWAGISFAAFTGFVTLLGVGGSILASIVDAAFETVYTFGKVVGEWAWNGIKVFFNWLDKQYEDSGVKSIVDSVWGTITQTIDKWFGGNKYVQIGVQWIGTTYTWLKGNFRRVIQSVAAQYKKVKDFIQSTPSGTLLGAFVAWLDKTAGSIPGVQTALSVVRSKFGASLSGDVKTLRTEITNQQTNMLKEMLEQHAYNMTKQGVGEDEIRNRLETEILPKLMESYLLQGLNQKQAIDAVEKAMQQARFSNANPNTGTATTKLINERAKSLSELIRKYDTVMNVGGNFNNEAIQASIKDSLERSFNVHRFNIKERERAAKLGNAPLSNAELEAFSEQFLINSLKAQTIRNRSTTDEAANAASEDFGFVRKSLIRELPGFQTAVEFYSDGAFSGVEGDTQGAIDTYNRASYASDAFKEFALGGIVSQKELNNILPLDGIGQDYIREKIKDIKVINKTQSKEEIRNITIIEETVERKDSYEVYTMQQLAKGILGV